MVVANPRLEERLKALTHPLRVRAFDAFSNPRGRVATTGQVATELGVTVDQLSYHVRALVRFGWLELVKEARKEGTGVIERFYRAIDVATYDDETWSALSPAERRTLTVHTVALLVADIAAADEVGSLYSRTDAHVSRTPLVIDDRAWAEVGARLLELYEDAERASAEAMNRVAAGESPSDELVPARFLALFFEPASWNRTPERAWQRPGCHPFSPPPMDVPSVGRRLKALTHPVRVRAFYAFNDPPGRISTPAEIADEVDVSLERISYHIRMLVELGLVEFVEGQGVGGATERRYRATHVRHPPLYDYDAWAELSRDQQRSYSRSAIGLIAADIAAADAAATLDSRLDRHLHRAPVVLDNRAWTDLEARLTAVAEDARTIQAESDLRHGAGTARECTPARLALLLFPAALKDPH